MGGVELEARDGTRIRITLEQVHEMQTIELLLEDAGHTDSIPLPNMDGDTLIRIETFLLSGETQENMTDQQFMDLLKAANYLDFEKLYVYLMPEWINKRPFPGPGELKGLVSIALYFYNGYNFDNLNVDPVLKQPFQEFISLSGSEQWNIRLAATNGHLAVVELLLKNGVDPTAMNNCAIRWAATNGHLAVVELLLKNGADSTTNNNFAIRYAAINGHLAVVELLLKNGADLAARDNFAIRYAAYNGHLTVVDLLLKNGADPTADDNIAIRYAASNGHLAVVDLLLKNGADPTANNNYAIRHAAENGHLAVVDLLLKNGADCKKQRISKV